MSAGQLNVRVWVDADSCPLRVREIIAKAAARVSVPAVYVANRNIPIVRNGFTTMVVVSSEEGSADAHILANSAPGDLVVTRDILHAADLVERGVTVLNDRGERFTAENIRERVSIRNFMKELRQSGTFVPETNRYGPREIAAFSSAFDRELTRIIRSSGRPM